jgi:hypothetical protein
LFITSFITPFSRHYPLSPFRTRAAAKTFDSSGGFQIAQPELDHVAAGGGAGTFQFGRLLDGESDSLDQGAGIVFQNGARAIKNLATIKYM